MVTEMVIFTKLSIQNFKRFSGRHDIIFTSGEGRLTIIGAENGLGKTTLMEAFHIALYGKKGFQKLYPKTDYHTWMANAFSVDADDSGRLNFSLEMEAGNIGTVRISRTYWTTDGVSDSDREEFVVLIDGKLIQREGRQSLLQHSNNWVQDFIPQAAMRKFLVDGERLSELDPRKIDSEIVSGIDDVTGIGLLHRLARHLNNARRDTLASMAPGAGESDVHQLSSKREFIKDELNEVQRRLNEAESIQSSLNDKIVALQEEIENTGNDDRSKNGKLRIDYSVRQSELTSSRKEIHHLLEGPIPFIVARIPSDLEEWGFTEALAGLQTRRERANHLDFLNQVVKASGVQESTASKLITTGEKILDPPEQGQGYRPLTKLNLDLLEQLKQRFVELSLADAGSRVSHSMDLALARLRAFDTAEANLRHASQGKGISEKAAELRELARSLGATQSEIEGHRGTLRTLGANREHLEQRIYEIRQGEDPDSLFNKRLTRIDGLEKLVELVLNDVREKFSKPLEASFAEGFELLSRKSDRIEEVRINPNDYSLFLKMKGFDGNWLDRDLSATEKQHVGLALVYALRRASSEWSLPSL